jgi:hypothetical protein
MLAHGTFFPSKSRSLNGKTYTDGRLYLKDIDGKNMEFVGAFAVGGSGILMVHPSDNPDGENVELSLTDGNNPFPYKFNYIVETGTTITLANARVIPA